jgi:rhamnogalacturonyl hydrolase YesR
MLALFSFLNKRCLQEVEPTQKLYTGISQGLHFVRQRDRTPQDSEFREPAYLRTHWNFCCMKKIFVLFFLSSQFVNAQRANDVTTPLHALQPDYPVPYGAPKVEAVKAVLDKIFNYLDRVTPTGFVHRVTGNDVQLNAVDTNSIVRRGDFRLTSYEWGVTYSGMLEAGAATGDRKFADYTRKRVEFIVSSLPAFTKLFQQYPKSGNPFRQPIAPHALDDAGAVCAAMIKTLRNGGNSNIRPLVDNYINYITTKEFRLPDGTLARNRPQKNTLWLDDLYMSVPALAQMGKLTGEQKYFNDAVKQIELFSGRMFNKELNLYMHGWVEEMNVHPEIRWARANGWALMAMAELLDVLPENHKGRAKLLQQFQSHAKGLASFQSGQGFWHQLLDRTDSYLETSATAIYAYCFARGVNKGWLDSKAYAPAALLAWNAVTTKVNEQGQVEGTCVGTGMAFDPAFYYYRPVNVYAAHGYGPVLLAGAEVINMLNQYTFEINDSSLQLKSKKE